MYWLYWWHKKTRQQKDQPAPQAPLQPHLNLGTISHGPVSHFQAYHPLNHVHFHTQGPPLLLNHQVSHPSVSRHHLLHPSSSQSIGLSPPFSNPTTNQPRSSQSRSSQSLPSLASSEDRYPRSLPHSGPSAPSESSGFTPFRQPPSFALPF